MGLFVVAEMTSQSKECIVYRIKRDDRDEPDYAQLVPIPLDSSGHCRLDANITTLSGEAVTLASNRMIGKLLTIRDEQGIWPKLAAIQS
jgi:hypothetical protein